MGVFDDVITNAKSAAQTVGKVAGQFVDMSKLRLNLAELNGEINKRYQELGQFIYEAKKAGEADEVELAEKIAVLDELYAQFGAVSAPSAEAMAVGVRKLLNADVAVSVTGLAGPGGDEFGHPVGTVFIGYDDEKATLVKHCCFCGTREEIREQTIETALKLILEQQK